MFLISSTFGVRQVYGTPRTEKPVSLNDGRRRPSWFNISSLPPPEDEYDEMTISESLMIIDNLIRLQLLAGMDSRNVVLVGFSQGAALSLMLALTKTHKLGGVASLSGWIPHGARAVSDNIESHFGAVILNRGSSSSTCNPWPLISPSSGVMGEQMKKYRSSMPRKLYHSYRGLVPGPRCC